MFIQTDAHALIDAHPLSSKSCWPTDMDEIDDFESKLYGSILIFATILFSGDIFEVRFRAYDFVSTSGLAHAQWASI